MEPQFAYLIGYLVGILTVGILMLAWKLTSNKEEPVFDNLNLHFPKVWKIGYTSSGMFSFVIESLANKFIIEKGNLADFIRAVPFNTDGYHVGTISIKFGLVSKRYNKDEPPMVHTIILVRKDIG